ncbi:MAG TPA: hypothetical protein VEK07_14570 [Polyangiaceae bacterium]|nr:hypothetical protein [Polyangiaceae bacterium]
MSPLTAGSKDAKHFADAMSACALCRKPVVIDPDLLPDGRIVHASCKNRPTDAEHELAGKQPKSGSRIRVGRRQKQAG